MSQPMSPPISYYGGKQRMAANIIKIMPQHTLYVEPFCGSAAVLFKKPWPKVTPDHYGEVINDHDSDLINFYRQLRDNGEALCAALALTPYSRELYAESKDLTGGTNLARAIKYYVNIMQSFSHRLHGGWSISLSYLRRSNPWVTKVDRLPQFIDRMREVCVENRDAIDIIKQWDSPQTLFYCDPPYIGAHQGHYSGYAEADLKKLCDTLENCQGSFMLSSYNNNDIIPKHWQRFDFDAHASSSGQGRVGIRDKSRAATTAELGDTSRVESVWRRFNRAPVRPEIQALYDSGKFNCFIRRPKDLPFDCDNITTGYTPSVKTTID